MINPILRSIFILTLIVAILASIVLFCSKDEDHSINEITEKIPVITDNFIDELKKIEDKIIPPTSEITVKEGLVAYYPFNGNANDLSGNGNDGIVHGATLTEDRFSKPESAYYFDGASWITVKDSYSLKPKTSLTLIAWVNIQQREVNDYLRILSKHGEVTDAGGSHGSYQLVTGRQNARGGCFWTMKTNIKYYSSSTKEIATLNEWHMITATWDGETAILFFDDEIIAVNKVLGSIQYDSNPLYIGKDGYYNHNLFSGMIDDVRIYNRALDYKEIKTLYELK